MAFIGSLITTVRANVAPLVKGFKKAERRTRALRKDMKRLGGTFAKVGAVGIAVAGAALVAYTIKAFKAIDATAKLASEMQIATEDLISFQLAAGLSGTNTETLNKALQRMARTVGEARAGITTGTKALEDFGINVKDLQGLTTAQIFEEFAERIKNIEDPMIQAAKAALIFGRSGQKLLNFLKLGKSGLAAVKEEAEALGLAFDSIDARKVEEANDAILKMQTVAAGIGNTIAIEVAPFITKLANKMGDFIKAAGGIDTIVQKNLKPLALGIAQVVDVIQLARVGWNSFAAAVRSGSSIILQGVGFIVQGFEELTNVFNDTNRVGTNAFTTIGKEMERLAVQDIGAMNDAMDKFNDSVASKTVLEAFDEISRSSQDVANNLKNANKSMTILNKGPKELAAGFREAIREMEKLEAEQAKVIEAAKRIFEETRTPLESIEAEIKRINEIFSQGGFEGMESAFERKIKELKEAKKKIEDALKITGPTKEGIAKLVESLVDDSVEASFGLKKKKKVEREAGFKQIDVRNINVKGLAKFGSTDQKQLKEQIKANEKLNEIANNTKSGGKAKAV